MGGFFFSDFSLAHLLLDYKMSTDFYAAYLATSEVYINSQRISGEVLTSCESRITSSFYLFLSYMCQLCFLLLSVVLDKTLNITLNKNSLKVGHQCVFSLQFYPSWYNPGYRFAVYNLHCVEICSSFSQFPRFYCHEGALSFVKVLSESVKRW